MNILVFNSTSSCSVCSSQLLNGYSSSSFLNGSKTILQTPGSSRWHRMDSGYTIWSGGHMKTRPMEKALGFSIARGAPSYYGRTRETAGGEETPQNTKNSTRYLDEKVANAPEPVGDAGLLLPQPVVVRDADVVHVFEERVFPGKNQVVQAFGARLLHAFQTEPDVDWDFLREGNKRGEAFSSHAVLFLRHHTQEVTRRSAITNLTQLPPEPSGELCAPCGDPQSSRAGRSRLMRAAGRSHTRTADSCQGRHGVTTLPTCRDRCAPQHPSGVSREARVTLSIPQATTQCGRDWPPPPHARARGHLLPCPGAPHRDPPPSTCRRPFSRRAHGKCEAPPSFAPALSPRLPSACKKWPFHRGAHGGAPKRGDLPKVT